MPLQKQGFRFVGSLLSGRPNRVEVLLRECMRRPCKCKIETVVVWAREFSVSNRRIADLFGNSLVQLEAPTILGKIDFKPRQLLREVMSVDVVREMANFDGLIKGSQLPCSFGVFYPRSTNRKHRRRRTITFDPAEKPRISILDKLKPDEIGQISFCLSQRRPEELNGVERSHYRARRLQLSPSFMVDDRFEPGQLVVILDGRNTVQFFPKPPAKLERFGLRNHHRQLHDLFKISPPAFNLRSLLDAV